MENTKIKDIVWVTHPKEIACLYTKIVVNNITYHLTVGHTFATINSTNFNATFDALNVRDAKNKAISMVMAYNNKRS